MKKTLRTISFLLLISIMLINICACSPREEKGETGKDTLNICVNSDVSQFNPAVTNSYTDILALLQVYEPLVYKKGTEFVPGLADSWKINDDSTSIELKLRKDATFHDGSPCTADDVVFTFDTILARPSAASARERYKKVTATDPNTVVIELNDSIPAILSYLSSPSMGIISKAYVTEKGDDAYIYPIGTGAYKLLKWDKGSRISFEAYDKYNGPKASIRYLNFNVVKDNSTALVSLESGNNDVILSVPESDLTLVKKNDKLEMMTAPSRSSSTLVFNIRKGIMTDQNLRLAVAYAIDRNAINKIAYENSGFLAKGAYEGDLFYSGKDYSYDHDVVKAKEYLEKSNYKKEQTITIKTADAYGDVIPQIIQGQLSEIGVNLKIESLEMNAHSQDYLNGNFEIIFAGGSSIIPDQASNLHSSYYWPDNTWSPSSPDDDRFNSMLDDIAAETDAKQRTAKVDKMMQQLYELCNEVPLITKMSNIVYRKGLQGVYVDPAEMFYCFRDFSWEK